MIKKRTKKEALIALQASIGGLNLAIKHSEEQLESLKNKRDALGAALQLLRERGIES